MKEEVATYPCSGSVLPDIIPVEMLVGRFWIIHQLINCPKKYINTHMYVFSILILNVQNVLNHAGRFEVLLWREDMMMSRSKCSFIKKHFGGNVFLTKFQVFIFGIDTPYSYFFREYKNVLFIFH